MRAAVLAALAATALAACGSEDGDHRERGDRPAAPPRGWRTVENPHAGFTIAAPRAWRARTRASATLIRSRDRFVALTLAADRSRQGRESAPGSYARNLLQGLPDFEGSVHPRVRRIKGVPYRSARVEGQGSVRTSPRPQRITVAVYQRRGAVTYAAVVFRNALIAPASDDRVVNRILRTFRAQPPR